MAYDNDAFFTAWKAAFATQAGNQATMYAAEASGLAAYVVTTASANCTASLAARTAIHAAYVANGNTGPNPAVPGCTP